MRLEERIQVEPSPKCVGQPTRAPLTRTLQPQGTHAQKQSLYIKALSRRAVLGKQNHLLHNACVLVEDANRLLPRPMLRIAQLAKIENVPVNRARAVNPARLHDRPRPMFFPIFLAHTAFQKHAA